MKTKPRYKKSNLLSPKQREEMLVDAAHKANMILTLTILHDCFGFGEKRLQKFEECYKTLADSCEKEGTDDWRKLNEGLQAYGIKVV